MSSLSDFNSNERWEKIASDPRSTAQLIKVAVAEWYLDDEHRPEWPTATAILKARGDHQTLNTIIELSRSANPTERSVAAYLLGEFGLPERMFPEECREHLLGMLEREQDADVVATICSSFSHQELSGREVAALAPFRKHEDEDVRFGVVGGLLWCREPAAIAILIELMNDPDEDVRDWATFGVGQIIDTDDQPERFDTPEIRQALFDRLNDPHWPTKREAIDGLSLRRDPRVVDHIVDMLVDDGPYTCEQMCKALRDMKQHYTGRPERLVLALSFCEENEFKPGK